MPAASPTPPSVSCLFSHLNSYIQFVLLLCQVVSRPKLSGWMTSQVFTYSAPWGSKPQRASVCQPAGKLNKWLCKPNHAQPRTALCLQHRIYLIPVCTRVTSVPWFSVFRVPGPLISLAMLSSCRQLFWNNSMLFSEYWCLDISAANAVSCLKFYSICFLWRPFLCSLVLERKWSTLTVGSWLIILRCVTPLYMLSKSGDLNKKMDIMN